MTRLSITGDVLDAFPDLRVFAVMATGLDNSAPWPDVQARADELASVVADARWPHRDEHHPLIAVWHAAYRQFGTNPRRQRPSVDALTRRLARTGRLPSINPAVDAYNLVSVTHTVPAGAFDLDHVEGDITIRLAREGDQFIPLGEPDSVEQPHGGEVVYADAAGVLTRHWNHRVADRTKVTPNSQRVVFLLETVDAAAHHATLADAANDLAALLAGHAEAVTVETLDRARAEADLGATQPKKTSDSA